MKNSIKLTILALATSFLSCQRDGIEVVRNLDTSWTVDSEITEADIRTRLGYDSRFPYVYVEKTRVQMPVYMLLDNKVQMDYNSEVLVKLTKSYTKDVKVTLGYNAELFEQVKQNYQEHQLGDETYFQIEEREKILKAGQTHLVFNVKLKDIIPTQEKTLLPFSISVDDEGVKLSEGNTNAFVSVFKQQVSFDVSNEILVEVLLDSDTNIPEFDSDEIEATIVPSIVIPANFSLKLKKDESYQFGEGKKAFPEGSVQLPEKQSLKGQQFVIFPFEIQNQESFNEVADYVLPMQLVLVNEETNEESPLQQPVVITLKVSDTYRLPKGDNIEGSVSETSGHTNSSIKEDIEDIYVISGRTRHELDDKSNISDGNYDTASSFLSLGFAYPEGIVVNLSKVRRIQRLQLKMKTPIKSCMVFARYDDKFVYQGAVRFQGSGDYYVITFKKPIKAQNLLISQFTSNGDNIEIYEIDFN
ncbi:MAG: DUF1735 domain-containing protein [Capnocytophaga felis]|nr:DUF1735 domain-containing protein [Capnocytophaga felis]